MRYYPKITYSSGKGPTSDEESIDPQLAIKHADSPMKNDYKRFQLV